MIELIKLKCDDIYDACRVERKYIEELKATLNKNRPITTTIEKIEHNRACCKEYRENHKEEIKEYQKEYLEQHGDQIREYKNTKIICNYCNNHNNRSNLSRHRKTN